MKRSRRRFLKLLAAGATAAATPPALARAAAASRRATTRRPVHPAGPAAPPLALRAEIERQQRDLEKTLKTLRDHPLEPGSDPAFVFTPQRATRKP